MKDKAPENMQSSKAYLTIGLGIMTKFPGATRKGKQALKHHPTGRGCDRQMACAGRTHPGAF